MSVSKSYANALLQAAHAESLGARDLEGLEQRLKDFADALHSNPQLRAALCGPAATAAEKQTVLEQLGTKLVWPGILSRFFRVVSSKGRMDLISEIASSFSRARIESSGGVLGLLESSDPLSDEDVRQLSGAFTKMLGKTVAFERKTDPELLAGVKVTVAGTTYDGTLKAQLNRLKDRFFENSSSTH